MLADMILKMWQTGTTARRLHQQVLDVELEILKFQKLLFSCLGIVNS